MNVITISLIIGNLFFAILCLVMGIKMQVMYRQKAKYNTIVAAEYAKATPKDIIDYLNYLMDREFDYTVDLPFAAKEIKRITDFEGTLHELTTNTVHSINDTFMLRAEAAGVSQEYVLEFITRGCTIRIMKFMFDHNAGYIKGDEDEDTEV